MALFLPFIPTTISTDVLERAFDDTFGATVMVRFGNDRKNSYGIAFKTATVEVLGNTSEMRHFIDQVKKHGNNTFIADRVSYTVRMSQQTEVGTRIVPRII